MFPRFDTVLECADERTDGQTEGCCSIYTIQPLAKLALARCKIISFHYHYQLTELSQVQLSSNVVTVQLSIDESLNRQKSNTIYAKFLSIVPRAVRSRRRSWGWRDQTPWKYVGSLWLCFDLPKSFLVSLFIPIIVHKLPRLKYFIYETSYELHKAIELGSNFLFILM